MRILVIDDTPKHIEAARQTLADYNLTTCETYDEGIQLIQDEKWDVVLSDMLMPASSECLAEPEKYAGKEIPVGWAIAMFAAKCGVKYIAVGTDANHHDHPASAMLDRICEEVFTVNSSKVLMTAMRTFEMEKELNCIYCDGTGKGSPSFSRPGEFLNCIPCKGTGKLKERGKNWKNLLERLISEK